jgi:hypothetical protein
MTYFMALLILVGAGLVFFAKYIARRKAAPQEARDVHEDMARSTEQLKHELERSGQEIVKRMGGHVERLEALIAESDRRSDSLDAQLTELHTLSQTIDKEIDELRAAEQDARREQQLASQLLGELRAAAAGATAMRQAMPVPQRTAPIERVDVQDFTSVLERSIARDEARQGGAAPAYVPTAEAVHAAADALQTMQGRSQAQSLSEQAQAHAALPQEMPTHSLKAEPASVADDASLKTAEAPADEAEKGAGEFASAQEAPETEEPAEDEEASEPSEGASSAARVRALLLSGWSVEDVARETGMGKGAIELMQEMIRRQIADREDEA